MTILSDKQIRNLCLDQNNLMAPTLLDKPMIAPYSERQVRIDPNGDRCLSWGQSSYGYDIRVSNKFKIFTNINSTVVDPLNFKHENYVDFEGDVCIIPPNSFVLASTVEYFYMPDDVTGIVVGKSTYARCGVNCICTPLEAGWHGELVLEFANCTPLPVKLYAGQGAAQVFFLKGDETCSTSYATGGRKYQGQTGIQLPLG